MSVLTANLDSFASPAAYESAVPSYQPTVAKAVPRGARVRRGRSMVVIGFVVAIAGIIVYCVGVLSAAPAASAESGTPDLAAAGLVVIGIGTLLWLIGMVRHINAILDAPPAPPAPTDT